MLKYAFVEVLFMVRGGEDNTGYVSIDNIRLQDVEKCEVIPEFANPGTTTPNPDNNFQVIF